MRKSILRFHNYTVDLLKFEQHKCDIPETAIEMEQTIIKEVAKKENGYFDASLTFKTVPHETIVYPFNIEVKITGHFQIEQEADEADEGFNASLMNQNSYAILFPYLRAIITNLTGTANIPPIILPIINLNNGD